MRFSRDGNKNVYLQYVIFCKEEKRNFHTTALRMCKKLKLRTHNLTLFSQKLKHVSICGPCMRSQGWWRLFWNCHIRPTWHCYHALQARPNNSRSFATLLLLYRVSKKNKSAIVTRAPFCEILNSFWKLTARLI